MLALTSAMLLTPGTSAKAAQPAIAESYGPDPGWDRFRELAEASIRSRLIDPDSAKFDWPHGYVKRGYTPFWQKRVYGYTTCALVNSKNRMGGYTGATVFFVVIDNDRVLFTDFGKADGTDIVTTACYRGGYPPPPDVAASVKSTLTPTTNNYGFTVTAVPDGAYIATVTPAGEKAGLHSGMVITSFNGIGLKGLTAAVMSQIIGAATGPATLQFAGGTSARIEPATSATPRLEYAQ